MIKRAREEKRIAEEAKAIVQEGVQEEEKQKEADFEEHREDEEKERAQREYEAEFAKKREEKSEEKVEEEPPALEEVTAEQLQEEREQANIKRKKKLSFPGTRTASFLNPPRKPLRRNFRKYNWKIPNLKKSQNIKNLQQ